jgi:integron integrase
MIPFADGSGMAESDEDSLRWNEYRDWLRSHGVAERLLRYFVAWVEMWQSLALEELPGRDPARTFAAWLEGRGYESWRCRQAYQALHEWLTLDRQRMVHEPVVHYTGWDQALVEMENRLRAQHYSPRTLDSYLEWGRRLARSCPEFPRDDAAASEATQRFLRSLTLEKNLSDSSISQARNALAWLIRRVLGYDLVLEEKGDAHRGRRLPKIIAPEAVRRLLEGCVYPWDVFFSLQYGCGLRLMEILDLRVQEVDLVRNLVTVRHGKGDKDRAVPLPRSLRARMEAHLVRRRKVWEEDCRQGWAHVDLPHAMGRKFQQADASWEWQHVFGANRPQHHPETKELRRWHPLETTVREALRNAARQAGVEGRVHPHLLRHCYATHLLENGIPLKQIQELMGHARLETTMIYMHVRTPVDSMRSPLDLL